MSITDVRKDRSVGPSEPLNPLGPPEIRTKLHSGSHVARQRYTDGCLFEYKIAKGEPILFDPADILPLFIGTVLATYQDGGYNYLAIWVHDSQSGCLCKDHIGGRTKEAA